MKRIGVILCGQNFSDKNEIQEAKLVLNALEKWGAAAVFLTFLQAQEDDNKGFYKGVAEDEKRGLTPLTGLTSYPLSDISEIEKFMPEALIILSAKSVPVYFKTKENSDEMPPESAGYMDLLKKIHKENITIGLVGKSAILAPLLVGGPVRVTLGNDPDSAELIEELGGEAVICPADDIVIDDEQHIMTTPGFLAGGTVEEISQGIDKLVTRILGE